VLEQLLIGLPSMLSGLVVTLEISLLVIAIGTLIGFAGGLTLIYGPWLFRMLVRLYVDTVRGIPVLVLIFAFYYGLPVFFNLQIDAFPAGVIALSTFVGAHMTEVVRGAVATIPKNQSDAAKAIGLTFWKRLRLVILPLAARRILPPWVNTAVEVVKGSSLISLIGVVDLMLATRQIEGRTFITLPLYGLAALMYFVINYSISQLAARLERRYAFLRY
jgi:polar amino acid transport system permease protein